jgi:hypothetical protein
VHFLTNANEVKANISIGQTTESLHLEFKAVIKPLDIENRKQTAIDICALANHEGGTIIIGLSEKENENGLKVANAFINVPDQDRLRKFLDSDVRAIIFPKDIQYSLNIIKIDEQITVLSVCVKPLIDGLASVHFSGEREVIFPLRSSRGNEFLNPTEIGTKMDFQDRRVKLKMRSVVIGHKPLVNIMSPYSITTQDSVFFNRDNDCTYVNELDEFEFILSFNDVFTKRIPYSMVDHVWKISERKMGIALKRKLLIDPTRRDISISF